MKRRLYVLMLLTVGLFGCRALPEEGPSPQISQQNEDAPTIIVEARDTSIPLGDPFPVVVKVANAEPNEELAFEFKSGGLA